MAFKLISVASVMVAVLVTGAFLLAPVPTASAQYNQFTVWAPMARSYVAGAVIPWQPQGGMISSHPAKLLPGCTVRGTPPINKPPVGTPPINKPPVLTPPHYGPSSS
jgi:hypothetical protein